MPLLSGFVRAEITPKVPVRMGGYAARHTSSTGVHDPLFVRVLALRDGGREWVLAVLDVVGLSRNDAGRLRHIVAQETGLRPQEITLFCTHTHSGPQTLRSFASLMPSVEQRYLEWLAEPVTGAVSLACSRLEPATVRWARGKVEGVASDRRDPSRRAGGALDVLLVGGTGLVCFACHPTVLGPNNRRLSADLPGAALRYLEGELGAGCLFLQGAAGDLSTRFTRRGRTCREVRRLGERLGRVAAELAGRAREIPPCGLDAEESALELPRRRLPDPEATRRRISELQRSGGIKEDRVVQSVLEGALLEEALASDGAAVDSVCSVSAVRVGGAAFVTVGGELFSHLGEKIRARSPFSPTIVAGYANGYTGYLTGKAGYDPGSYESSSSPFEPEAGDLVVGEALRLLRNLDGRRA